MVLLTSSAISVAISSGIVFLFTFLLFLSGYVLQQQTVRSLQEALQAPVEVRVRLPQGYQREFDSAEDVLLAVAEGNDVVVEEPDRLENGSKASGQTVEIVLEQTTQQEPQTLSDASKELTPQQLWHAQIDKISNQPPNTNTRITINTTPPLPLLQNQNPPIRLAYVLTLPTPSHLCSALLFTKHHRQSPNQPPSSQQPTIIYLYPSNWETTPSNPIYTDALRLLIQSEHEYSVLLHPVQISKIWTGIDVESQLLSELARNPWVYDRVMYLRSPGILVDAARLDGVLVESVLDPGIVKRGWTRLRAPVRRGGMVLRPDVLMFAQGRGLMVPVGAAGSVTARAGDWVGQGEEGRDNLAAAAARNAAYVLFEEDEVVDKGKWKSGRDDLLGMFERERRAVCEGTLLLS